jgi:hypothetical protein
MHPDDRAGYSVQFRPYVQVWLVCCRGRVVLYRIDVAADYEIVLHLLFPEVEVRPFELPYAHFR